MTQHFEFPLELKFLAETGTFEGYASVFNVIDKVNDKIAPGAFKESLSRHRAEGRLPPLLWQHDHLEPIGAWREMYEDMHGLYVKGDLFIRDLPMAREAYKLLKENVVTGLSIGYRAVESHREQKSAVRVLTKLDLVEVSLVTFPANEQARVIGVKALSTASTPRELENFLHAHGLSRRQAKGVVAQGYKSLRAEAENPEAAALIDAVKTANEDLALRNLLHAVKSANAEMVAMKYNENHVPAGQPGGGRFASGNGISSGGGRAGFGMYAHPAGKNPLLRNVAMGRALGTEGVGDSLDETITGLAGGFGGRGGGGGAAVTETEFTASQRVGAEAAAQRLQSGKSIANTFREMSHKEVQSLENVMEARGQGLTHPEDIPGSKVSKIANDIQGHVEGNHVIKNDENFVFQKKRGKPETGDKQVRIDRVRPGEDRKLRQPHKSHGHVLHWNGTKWVDTIEGEHRIEFKER